MNVLALVSPAAAQEAADSEDFTVAIGSRTFLLGEPPRNAGRINGFLPLSSIRSIQNIVLSDLLPGAQGSVLSISQRPSNPAYPFGPEETPKRLGSRNLVPEYFRQPALRAEVSPGDTRPIVQYLYMPEGVAPAFLTVCFATWNRRGKDWVFCGLNATYPPAREITLEARIYRPTAPATFGTLLSATVARLAAHPTLAGGKMALPS